MINYQNVSGHPVAFHRLFGCSMAEFDTLYKVFADAYEQRINQLALTRRKTAPRKRRRGAGRRFKHPLRERLLLALFWLRVYPTLELLGHFFALDKTSAEDNLKDILATLETLPSFILKHPGDRRKRLHTREQLLEAFPDAALAMDSTQDPGT